VFCPHIEWITFHSAYDFGYLLKLCTGALLPETKYEFYDTLKNLFPHFYDMKYLLKFCDLYGGLSKVAESLQALFTDLSHSIKTSSGI